MKAHLKENTSCFNSSVLVTTFRNFFKCCKYSCEGCCYHLNGVITTSPYCVTELLHLTSMSVCFLRKSSWGYDDGMNTYNVSKRLTKSAAAGNCFDVSTRTRFSLCAHGFVILCFDLCTNTSIIVHSLLMHHHNTGLHKIEYLYAIYIQRENWHQVHAHAQTKESINRQSIMNIP